MKAVIIEDETTAVNSLKAILAQNTVTPIEVIAELESIEESVEFFRTSPHPDIIFMDIHLADGSAFKIFEQVEIDAPVVFTTAYDCSIPRKGWRISGKRTVQSRVATRSRAY